MLYALPLLALAAYSYAHDAPLKKSFFRRSIQTLNGVPSLDGVPLSEIPGLNGKPVPDATAGAISQSGWTATCDSFQTGNECAKAIDGNSSTFWLTAATAALPHSITIDMKTSQLVGSVSIAPRGDGNNNGHIGQHTIALRYVFLESTVTDFSADLPPVQTAKRLALL